MIPRKPTQADCDYWGDGATVGPMLGRHVGAADIEVIRHPDGKVRVPWVVDERDELHGLREGVTVWTTFWGGMVPTDAVIVDVPQTGPGACGDPACPVLHEDPANPIHPPGYVDSRTERSQ